MRYALALLLLACAGRQSLTDCTGVAGWSETGQGPPGLAVVVSVVRTVAPNLPSCGVVAWQPGPFDCTGDGKPDCSGQREAVMGPPRLDVVTAARIEQTALIHEMGHLVGYADGAAMDAWVAARTAEVTARLP